MFINVPLARIFSRNGELVDEGLFGEDVTLLKSFDRTAVIKSAAGKIGITDKSNLSLGMGAGDEYRVISRFADFNINQSFHGAPYLTLSGGSVFRGKEAEEEIVTVYRGKKLYVRKSQVAKNKKRRFNSEEALRGAVIGESLKYLGTPYRWGGRSFFGIDCSGLVYNAYKRCGISLPRDAEEIRKVILPAQRESLQIGDLVFFPGHIAIYLGSRKYIHAGGLEGEVAVGNLENKSSPYYREPVSFGSLPIKKSLFI